MSSPQDASEPIAGSAPPAEDISKNVAAETNELRLLSDLTADVRDQDDLERDMALKVRNS
jgi:hypothetical protein